MERQITKDGVIVIDDEEIDGEELVSIMRSRDTYAGWKRDGDKRIAELEAALKKIADTHHDIGSYAQWARSVAREALKEQN